MDLKFVQVTLLLLNILLRPGLEPGNETYKPLEFVQINFFDLGVRKILCQKSLTEMVASILGL